MPASEAYKAASLLYFDIPCQVSKTLTGFCCSEPMHHCFTTEQEILIHFAKLDVVICWFENTSCLRCYLGKGNMRIYVDSIYHTLLLLLEL